MQICRKNMRRSKLFAIALAFGVILMVKCALMVTNNKVYITINPAVHPITLNIDEAIKPVALAVNNDLPWWEGGSCSSTRNKLKMTDDVKGYCGYRSSTLGKGQKVISYSLFGSYTEYATGLSSILNSTAALYSEWVVRLYTDPRIYKDHLCPLLERFPHFHICDVTNLPGPPYNYSEVDHMLWRVSPLGDEQVDVFLSRDIDAEVLPREVDAVAEFLLEEDALLHVMRDHPFHGVPILGGTFGVRQNDSTRGRMNDIRSLMMQSSPNMISDQVILATYLFPALRNYSVQHDCCTCQWFPGSVPFPTKRQDEKFVGNVKYRKEFTNDRMQTPCPTQCRPKDHQDWEYC